MPVLKARVDAEITAHFRRMAKARGLSESELLRAAVLAVTGQKSGPAQIVKPDPENADTERMTVRMPRFLMDAAKSRAKAKGMAPSRWVAALVQSNLTGQPVMTDAELAALLASNYQLTAIGNNINQIAKAINKAFHETERVRLDKLAELGNTIAEHQAVILTLVRASQNDWGAE